MWNHCEGGVNVSLETTVDPSDSSHLTLTAEVVHSPSSSSTPINASDYLLIVYANYTNGRAGTVSADAKALTGISAGLRSSQLSLIQGATAQAVINASQLPSAYLGVSLVSSQAISRRL